DGYERRGSRCGVQRQGSLEGGRVQGPLLQLASTPPHLAGAGLARDAPTSILRHNSATPGAMMTHSTARSALKKCHDPGKTGKNLVFVSGTTLAYCHGKKAFSAAAFRTARHWQADGGRYNLIDSSNGARNDELRFVRSGRFFCFRSRCGCTRTVMFTAQCGTFSRRNLPCRSAGSGANSRPNGRSCMVACW